MPRAARLSTACLVAWVRSYFRLSLATAWLCGGGLWLATALVTLGQEAKEESAPESDQPPAQETGIDEDEELPKLDQMALPSFQRLMRGPPVDWIVLTSQKVLQVEPVSPRPGTLEFYKEKMKPIPRKPGMAAETERERQARLAFSQLPVTLLEGEERDFQMPVRFIRSIIYYEDLMLQRVDKLLDERQVRQAYELLVALDERQADWPGVEPRRDRLLFSEARVQMDAGKPEQALAHLESLFDRNAAYPELTEQLGVVSDQLMNEALQQRDARRTRFFLKRLGRRIPAHKVVVAWTQRLAQGTRDLLSQAQEKERAGQIALALDLAEEGARLWPELPELLPVYNRLANRRQRLRVGVLELSQAAILPPGTVAGRAATRHRQLTTTPMFQPSRVDNKIARFQTRFFQEWTPTELGHSVLFRLQPAAGSSASQPELTAAALLSALADRRDPASRHYDARFAAAVAGLAVKGPWELAVQFRQVPLRPEGLFTFSPPLAAGPFGSGAGQGIASVADGPPTYPMQRVALEDARQAVYRRTVSEPETIADRHVAEVLEIGYPSHEKAIQGLLRGEVSLLPQIPLPTLKTLADRSEFFTLPYGLPTTHLLQFHPRSRALQSRALRRALLYAIDRPRLLKELFVKEANPALGRLTTAPWPTTIYAYNRFILPQEFDPALAYSLARNAERELGEKCPPLRVWIPDDSEAREAGRAILDAWSRIGIATVVVSPRDHPQPPAMEPHDWDVAYRLETLAEPLQELWPFLALTSSTETTALGYLPTWLRHDLLELDRVGDWRSAEQILHKLHRQFWAEVHLIPLWEIDEHYVVRRNVRNLPDRPLAPYQAIEQWKVEPWYPRD
ncbi:MAG: ABC transporter substrate-binding protein [Planctomycetales bacterium]